MYAIAGHFLLFELCFLFNKHDKCVFILSMIMDLHTVLKEKCSPFLLRHSHAGLETGWSLTNSAKAKTWTARLVSEWLLGFLR